jgi:hypothetical protein
MFMHFELFVNNLFWSQIYKEILNGFSFRVTVCLKATDVNENATVARFTSFIVNT